MPKLLSKITFHNYKAAIGKLLLLFLLLFSYSSCSDQGCIEADDFGEYEQEILFVKANASEESCAYDPTKDLHDTLQGSGLKMCLTSGNIAINDGINAADYNSRTGCSGFDGDPDIPTTIKSLCVEECRQKCVNDNRANSFSAEPDWVSTSKKESGKNIGVTITPGDKIFIRAVGNVVLGGAKEEEVFTKSTESGLQSKQDDFSSAFMDVMRGDIKDIKFSGKWNSGSDWFGGDAESTDVDEKARAFNGANSVVAYVIPHPAGYEFDASKSTERLGTKGTPLNVDTALWTCSYDAGSTNQQQLCNSLEYNTSNGYPNIGSNTASSFYNITSSRKADNLGDIGGMIRYENDGLKPMSEDPFASISCNPICSGVMPNSNVGGFIGDLSTGRSITNNKDYAVRVVFKNLGVGVDGNSCNTNLFGTINYRDVDGNDKALPEKIIGVNTNWSTAITLEPNDRIEFNTNTNVYGTTTTNCGDVIAYRFNKLHDITINKSGFVSFTRLAASGSSGTCYLNGRIINPLGSRVDFNGPLTADFYEYSTSTNPTDPINNLSVPINITSGWSDKVFVRKGQVIRFDPTSWNLTWVPGAGAGAGSSTRECGIGTAMQIEARPAFLCRGEKEDDVPNPLCIKGVEDDGSPTCQAYSADCFSTTPADKYCPSESCQNFFEQSSCAVTGPPAITDVSYVSCRNCFDAKTAAGAQPLEIPLTLRQCYDLENYRGKVSNISSTTGFTDGELGDPDILKGAKKLGAFDGRYGNFSSFIATNENESLTYNNNKIYLLSTPASFNDNGRLKFLIVDNNAFIDNPSTGDKMTSAYSDNVDISSSYNGRNGYKIDLSGRQEFRNGQWLEAILCKENDDNSHLCSSDTIPIQVGGQPKIVTIKDPIASGQDPQITSYYQFDPFGSISRFNNPADPADLGIVPVVANDPNFSTAIGDNFYRHAYEYHAENAQMSESSENNISNLRISFKIKDPEITNCIIATPLLNQVCRVAGVEATPPCDGVSTKNPFYSSGAADICGNGEPIGPDNAVRDHSVDPPTESVANTNCQKQFFCANKYYNNEGKYQVIVKVENKGSNISNIVNQVISPVIEIMDGSPDGTRIGQAERVYKEIISDSRFQLIIQMLVVTMITFYGVGYLMGVSEFSQAEVLGRIIKIGVIYLFVSPEGWYWFDRFFVSLFKDGVDYITFLMASSFDRSTELQNAISTNSFYDKSVLFSGIDKVFGMFFSSAVQKKISALLFASIFGWAYLYIIYLSFFLYVYAVANSVLLYLTAQVFISILFVLGPLFFLSLLFSQTKEMFDKWLSELIGFSLQQIFLLTTLAFFNMMMYEIIKMSLGFKVCWDDVWIINIYITRIKLLSFWTIASLPPRLDAQSEVGNIGNPEGIPSIFSILFIYIVASLMHKFVGFMTDVGASIGNSVKASSMAAGVKAAGEGMRQQAKAQYQQKIGSKIDSATQSVDRALFDSGKKADADRAERQDQDKSDAKNRTTLAKAGTAGVSNFKKENAVALASATPEQQRKMVTEARDEAMKSKAKDMGFNEADTKKLMEGKSSITNARNLSDLVQEGWQKRGSLRESLADKKVNTTLSGSEIGAAMKNADDDDRAILQEKVEKGNLQVNVSARDRAAQHFDQAKEHAQEGEVGKAFGSLGKSIGSGIKSSTADKVTGAVSSTLSAAASGTSSGIKGVRNVLPSKFGGRESSNYKERQKLESEGEINEMRSGTKWAASDTDKAKISERVKQSKLTQKDSARKPASESDNEFVAKFGDTRMNIPDDMLGDDTKRSPIPESKPFNRGIKVEPEPEQPKPLESKPTKPHGGDAGLEPEPEG